MVATYLQTAIRAGAHAFSRARQRVQRGGSRRIAEPRVTLAAAPETAHAPLHPSDRAAERLIRERVAEAVSRSVGDGRLLAPGSHDEERVRVIIEEEVAAHERCAVT